MPKIHANSLDQFLDLAIQHPNARLKVENGSIAFITGKTAILEGLKDAGKFIGGITIDNAKDNATAKFNEQVAKQLIVFRDALPEDHPLKSFGSGNLSAAGNLTYSPAIKEKVEARLTLQQGPEAINGDHTIQDLRVLDKVRRYEMRVHLAELGFKAGDTLLDTFNPYKAVQPAGDTTNPLVYQGLLNHSIFGEELSEFAYQTCVTRIQAVQDQATAVTKDAARIVTHVIDTELNGYRFAVDDEDGYEVVSNPRERGNVYFHTDNGVYLEVNALEETPILTKQGAVKITDAFLLQVKEIRTQAEEFLSKVAFNPRGALTEDRQTIKNLITQFDDVRVGLERARVDAYKAGDKQEVKRIDKILESGSTVASDYLYVQLVERALFARNGFPHSQNQIFEKTLALGIRNEIIDQAKVEAFEAVDAGFAIYNEDEDEVLISDERPRLGATRHERTDSEVREDQAKREAWVQAQEADFPSVLDASDILISEAVKTQKQEGV